MKEPIHITTPLTDEVCRSLSAGGQVLLSGGIYTGRDVAHRRLYEAILKGEELPIGLRGEVLFYAAPTPAPPGRVIGSVGPTTSSRMDSCTPELIKMGLKGMIGKGKRSSGVVDAIRKYGAVYFGAAGGVAALLARSVRAVRVVAYEDLGPEAILRMEVSNMPLVVLIDVHGTDLYEEAIRSHRKATYA